MNLAGDILIGAGGVLMLLAGLGLLRLPDVFSRMHAGTKAATLGLALILAGSALHMQQASAVVKLLAAIAFQLITSPVAAHVIGRGAYIARIPLWEGTLIDELAEMEAGDPGAPEPAG